MLTNNWYNFMKAFYAGISGVDTSLIPVVDISGGTNAPSSNLSNYSKNLFPTCEPDVVGPAYTDRGVWFGDGNVKPSVGDYCLSGNRVTAYSVVSSSYSSSIQGDEQAITCIYTLKNTASEPITISEVCWIAGFQIGSNYKGFMLDRVLLDTPVVIQAGEQGVILYRRSITVPST